MQERNPARGAPTQQDSGRRSRRLRRLSLALGVLLLLWVYSAVPIPFLYAFQPGPVREVGRLVQVGDVPTYSSEGEFFLTTVSVDTALTPAELTAAIIDRNRTVVTKEQVTGDASLEQLERTQRMEMTESKRHAQEVALGELGYQQPTGRGARIHATLPETSAAELLKPGDVIVSVGGNPVDTTCDVGAAVAEYDVGQTVDVVVRRDGVRKIVEVRTVANPQVPGEALLGVEITTLDYSFNPGVSVGFKTGNIAGPSAGLMLALALYDRLTSDDLTGGRRIAGTGTIGCDGRVGPIGGVEQKVAAAELQEVEIFLAPAANAAAARRVAQDMEVVSVATFDEALGFLKNLE